MDSLAATTPRDRQAEWPTQSGAVPPLSPGYIARPESAPDLSTALMPGGMAVLTPGQAAAAGRRSWLGSCGKTQLAVDFAQTLWQSQQADLLVWVVASSRASVLAGLAAAAAVTGIEVMGTAEATAARFVSWLAQTSRPWLVVLDDLRDAADLDGLSPEGPTGRVLITSASPEAVPGEHRALVFPVGAFSTREALSYLMGRLAVDPDQRLGAIDLVEHLGCEPVALAQAAAVITSSGLSCREYSELFARRRAQLADGDGRGSAAAAVTWTLCVEHAQRLAAGDAAQPLLALAALLDGHAIPGTVLTSAAALDYLAESTGAVTDQHQAWDSLLSLERAGLVSVASSGTPPSVRMSPALQQAVRSTMPDALLARAGRAAADALVQAWPNEALDESLAWPATGLQECAASLLLVTGDLLWAGHGPHPLLLRAGQSLTSSRLTGPAASYWTELAEVSDQFLGADSPVALASGCHLADVLVAGGRAAEAVPWARWVLAGRAQELGPDDAETVSARTGLGRTLLAAGQPGEAAELLEAATADTERLRGADHVDTLGARDELAAALSAAGSRATAIELYQRTVSQRERIQGQRHPDTLTTRLRLADAYLAEGRTKDGIAQHKRVLADRERVLGADHPDTIAACASLASGYHQAGRMALAVQFAEQAHASYERVLGADHPDTLASCMTLARAYYAVGRLGDTAALLGDTTARCERVMPPGHPLTHLARESLANIAG